jgi:hypothetical protein
MGVENVKPPLALIDKLLPLLFCNTTVPVRPETVPPILKVLGGGGGVEDVMLVPPHPVKQSAANTVNTKMHDFMPSSNPNFPEMFCASKFAEQISRGVTSARRCQVLRGG